MGTAGLRSNRLRSAYREAQATDGDAVEAEVTRHLPLVHSVVERLCSHLPPTIDKEDLLHAGVIGLIDAVRRFDASRDNAFSTYAVLRIRGQVIDEMRARDWVPRGARDRAREYQQAVAALNQRLGRLPHDHELAQHLGVDEHELLLIEREAQLAVQVSLEAPVGEDGRLGGLLSARTDGEEPSRRMERDDRKAMLARVLATLSEQERIVVKLYYFENLLMKEIAEVLGVTESRVCQIHTRIIAVLRARLGDPESIGWT